VALALAAAACSDAARTTGATADLAAVVVEERTFVPIPGAEVAVAGVTTTTGAAGAFAVRGVAPGGHVLTVTAAGYLPYSKTIDLPAGLTDLGQLWLQPAGDGGVPPADGGRTDGPRDAGPVDGPRDAGPPPDAPPQADAGPDGPPACAPGSLRCGGACAVCPAAATATACQGATCVATACDVGFALCSGDCCGWTSSTVATVGSGESASIRVDGQNRAHVAYANDQVSTVAYALADGDATNVQTIASGRGRDIAMTLDGSGQPVVVYVGATDNVLYLARPGPTAGSWAHTQIATTAGEAGVAVAPGGTLHVVYRDTAAAALKHLSGTAPPLASETLDTSGEPGWFASVAVAADGTIHITHWAYMGQELRYLRSGAAWLHEVVEQQGFSQGAVNLSLALDPGGVPHIAFVDYAYGLGLSIASRTGGTWTSARLTPARRVEYLALAIDGAGHRHAAYWGFDDTSVYHATDAAGVWEHDLVVGHAMPGTLGGAIAVGPNGRPQVVYTTYYTTADLMLARW
jgi:hypothetical protein